MKRNVTKEAFKKIRDKILELMKTEGSDWTKSWIGSGAPTNFLSKKDDLITVKTFGGEITFKKIKDAILMKGPTTFIYKGNINE